MKPTLFLLMGLPGAGKTTTAKILESLTGAIRLSSDEIRLKLWPKPNFSEAEHQQLYRYLDQETAALLRAGNSVIYDANLNRFAHRQEKYELAESLNVKCVLLWVQTPHTVARKRRIEDNLVHLLQKPDNSPAEMFDRISKIMETPAGTEPFVSLDGTRITPEYVTSVLQAQVIN